MPCTTSFSFISTIIISYIYTMISLFLDYNLITKFLSSHSISNPSYVPLPTLLQIHNLLFYYLLSYVYMYTINLNIPKYTLLGSYSITCVYVFRAHCLALDNPLVCSSRGKTTSPPHSFSHLPTALCVGLRPLVFFPIQFEMIIGFICAKLMYRQSRC